MADEDDVRRIAMSLPETTHEDLSYSVRGKSFAWTYMERVHPKRARVPRPDVLAVRVDGQVEKQALLESDPATYFTTDHYNGYPAVLVRLPEVDADELSELLTDGWRVQAPRSLVKEFDARGRD